MRRKTEAGSAPGEADDRVVQAGVRADMRQALKQMAVYALILAALCVLARVFFVREYTVYMPLGYGDQADQIDMTVQHPELVTLGEPEFHEGYARIRVVPRQAGEVDIQLNNRETDSTTLTPLKVSPLMTVFDRGSMGFTGDWLVLMGYTLFFWGMCAVMLWHFLKARGPVFYSYATISYAGFSLFAGITALRLTETTVEHLLWPQRFSMFAVYRVINSASVQFMEITTPLIVLFALAMAVSNLALLRHERAGLVNVLGLGISVLLLLGTALGWWMFSRDFSGSEWEGRVRSALESVYATVFVYFECMLAGSMLCGLRAAKQQPTPDRDFIIILGCWFRKDGTLPPLLRDRVEKAIAFWHRQREETGHEAVLIPAGGKGADEPMPEGEAMRRYLLSRDIPERMIRPETKSVNTLENLKNARTMMEKMLPGGQVAFVTTNYHVFRSGIWAGRAGLEAQGLGSRTKWWYWPNAFMRECLGLMKNRWKEELLLLFLLLAFFTGLNMVL